MISMAQLGKESVCNAGDPGLIPQSGRFPGGGCGNSFQYSCLENPMDRGAWKAMVQSIGKNWTCLKWLSTHTLMTLIPLEQHMIFVHCSVAKSCLTLCNPMDYSKPGFPVLHCLPEFAQSHIHWVNDAIKPSHPLFPHSPPILNLSQPQILFQWVGSSHQVAKVLELRLQHQSILWIFRVDIF